MDEQALKVIGAELAVLVRSILSLSAPKNSGNLDRSAFLIMRRISAQGPLGVKALAEDLHLNMSTVSRQAAVLEKKGLLYRIPDPQDKRAYSFQLTDSGTHELAEYKKAQYERMKELLKDWSDEECQDFGEMLEKFNRSFKRIT